MQRKFDYPICNAMMDMYHEPHGAGSGFVSLMTTLSSATLSWVRVLLQPLSFPIPEISYVGSFVSHVCSCEA